LRGPLWGRRVATPPENSFSKERVEAGLSDACSRVPPGLGIQLSKSSAILPDSLPAGTRFRVPRNPLKDKCFRTHFGVGPGVSVRRGPAPSPEVVTGPPGVVRKRTGGRLRRTPVRPVQGHLRTEVAPGPSSPVDVSGGSGSPLGSCPARRPMSAWGKPPSPPGSSGDAVPFHAPPLPPRRS
jgi:hypothetical protein